MFIRFCRFCSRLQLQLPVGCFPVLLQLAAARCALRDKSGAGYNSRGTLTQELRMLKRPLLRFLPVSK